MERLCKAFNQHLVGAAADFFRPVWWAMRCKNIFEKKCINAFFDTYSFFWINVKAWTRRPDYVYIYNIKPYLWVHKIFLSTFFDNYQNISWYTFFEKDIFSFLFSLHWYVFQNDDNHIESLQEWYIYMWLIHHNMRCNNDDYLAM